MFLIWLLIGSLALYMGFWIASTPFANLNLPSNLAKPLLTVACFLLGLYCYYSSLYGLLSQNKEATKEIEEEVEEENYKEKLEKL